MFDDHKALEADFAGFHLSRHAKLLVSLPGCVAYGLNSAYVATKGLSFPGARELAVRTLEEYLQTLKRAADHLPPKANSRHAFRCYCGKVSSILALRKADCVHEDHYRLFVGYGGDLRFASGWEFNLAEGLTRGDRRVYEVLRVHSRLMGHRPAVAGQVVEQAVDGMLEVRFVPAPSLRLVVEGLPEGGALSARIVLTAGRSRRDLISLAEVTVDRESLLSYQILDEALARAGQVADLGQARTILESAEREIAAGADPVYPVTEIITSLFEDQSSGAKVTLPAIRSRVKLVRARLWDGPVIASRMRRKLDLTLLSPGFGEEIAKLPLEIGAELANVTMSASQLDAADIYLAA